jgi:hypothetical protein
MRGLKMRNYRLPAFLLAAALLPAAQAHAADAVTMSPVVTETEVGGWTFAISPYFWAAGLSGDLGIFGQPTVHVDADFSDIFDHLDFAMMAIGEARNDRFSIFADVMYTKLGGDGETPGPLFDSVDVTSETFAGLLGVGYSVLQDGNSRLDLVAGARVWSVDTDISFSGGIIGDLDVSDGDTWVDGLVGVRGRYDFNENWYLTGWGLIGAGGADLDWDVAGGLGYQFNDTWSAVAGYRALGVDYSNDGFVFDVVQQGPILGVVAKF